MAVSVGSILMLMLMEYVINVTAVSCRGLMMMVMGSPMGRIVIIFPRKMVAAPKLEKVGNY